MAIEDEWLSVDQAAAFLGVGRRAVHKYVKQGKLTAYKTGVGGRTLFRREDLDAFKRPRPIKRSGETEESRRAA